MARKIVPLRPGQQETTSEAQKPPLTLADVAIAWEEGAGSSKGRTHFVTGKTLVRLIYMLRHRNPWTAGHDPIADESMRVPMFLRGLSYLVFPDPGTPNEDLDKDVRFTLSELLFDLSTAVVAGDGLPEAQKYRVHVGPIPEEWTK